jgi:hypothetical protein
MRLSYNRNCLSPQSTIQITKFYSKYKTFYFLGKIRGKLFSLTLADKPNVLCNIGLPPSFKFIFYSAVSPSTISTPIP